jgi:hypothetical protein
VSGKNQSAHKVQAPFQRHAHRAGRGLTGCGRARATTAPHRTQQKRKQRSFVGTK